MRIAIFTGNVNQPSSRYRIRQYIDKLKNNDIEVDDFSSTRGKYPPLQKYKRVAWLIKTAFERFKQTREFNNNDYEIAIVQREMISTLYTFERFLNKPQILDVDDAIHLYRGGKFIEKIARKSDAVICGNKYLANVYSKWNKKIYIIPTAVDTNKFIPAKKEMESEFVTIGWGWYK